MQQVCDIIKIKYLKMKHFNRFKMKAEWRLDFFFIEMFP